MLISPQKAPAGVPAPALRRSVRIAVGPDGALADFMTFKDLADPAEHVALGFGAWREQAVLNVRLHSECLTGDVFGSARCDCGAQLHESMRLFAAVGGVIVYLRQEGRGIGLYNKIDAYALQDEGHDTFVANEMLGLPLDSRDFTVAADILRVLGKTSINLLSNNPEKSRALEAAGIVVVEQRRTGVFVTTDNAQYLSAKAQKAGHRIALHGPVAAAALSGSSRVKCADTEPAAEPSTKKRLCRD